jgi:hypothetical protein
MECGRRTKHAKQRSCGRALDEEGCALVGELIRWVGRGCERLALRLALAWVQWLSRIELS